MMAAPPEVLPMRRKKHDPKVAVAVVRVSTGRQALGPEAQRAAIQAWADKSGVCVVESFEEHVSGAADPSKRPGFVAALAAVERHRAGVMVFHEASRVARDMDLSGYLRTVVRYAGAELVATDASGSRIEDQVKAVLAEHERREIGARTKRALAVKRDRGEKISRHAPFGSRFTPDGRVVPDEREQKIVGTMRRMRSKGVSYEKIAARLNETTKPRKGSERWHPMTVARALLAPRPMKDGA
jgi:DNA invertase Pin-like site-specific DNA recombinase